MDKNSEMKDLRARADAIASELIYESYLKKNPPIKLRLRLQTGSVDVSHKHVLTFQNERLKSYQVENLIKGYYR